VFINGRPLTELAIDSAADIDLMKKDWRLIGQKKR